jgi:hypothetical protein
VWSDLDLVCTGPEARERVHEPLQPILGLDYRRRVRAFEHVRLVVGDKRHLTVTPEDVEPAMQKDAVVLEGERPFRTRAGKTRETPGELGATVGVDHAGDAVELFFGGSWVPVSYRRLERLAGWSSRSVERNELEEAVHRVTDLGRRQP